MCLRECESVLVDIVAVCALDLRDLMHATCDQTDDIDPENILHAAARDGAAGLLRQRIEPVNLCRCRRPRINRLLTGGDNIDATCHALLYMIIDVVDEAEQRHDRYIFIALIEHLIGVV